MGVLLAVYPMPPSWPEVSFYLFLKRSHFHMIQNLKSTKEHKEKVAPPPPPPPRQHCGCVVYPSRDGCALYTKMGTSDANHTSPLSLYTPTIYPNTSGCLILHFAVNRILLCGGLGSQGCSLRPLLISHESKHKRWMSPLHVFRFTSPKPAPGG